MEEKTAISARVATIDVIMKVVLPNFINPVPSKETLRAWFDAAGIPRYKANPSAIRGGGRVFYSLAAVEKLMRQGVRPRRARATEFNGGMVA